MNKFKNANLKFLMIPMIIITICTSLIISIVTINQYKKVTQIANTKIANIIGKIKENYPEIDTKEIIEILNQDTNSSEFKEGKTELLKYGIDIEEINSIVSVQNQMKTNLIVNVIVIIAFSVIWVIAILIYLGKRDKKSKNCC